MIKYLGNLISVNRDNDFIAKRIELEIGVKGRASTWSHYTLYIGYAKSIYTIEGNRLYFTNCYYLIKLFERKADTFPVKCYPFEDSKEWLDEYYKNICED